MCSHSTIFLRQGFADLLRDLKHAWNQDHPFLSLKKKKKGRQNAVVYTVHSTLGGTQELEAEAWMKLVL